MLHPEFTLDDLKVPILALSFAFLLGACEHAPTPQIPSAVFSTGESWEPLTTLSDTVHPTWGVQIWDMNVDLNNDIYIASPYSGVFRSTDIGKTWQMLDFGLQRRQENGWISADAIGSSNNYVFVSVFSDTNSSLFRQPLRTILNSYTGAWQLVHAFQRDNYQSISTIAFKEQETVFAGGYYTMLRTTNDGDSWTPLSSDVLWPGAGYPYAFVFDANKVYIATRNGIFLSTNSGDSWQESGLQSIPILSLAQDPKSRYLFAGSERGTLYRSTNEGNSWSDITGPDTLYTIHDVLVTPNNLIFAGTWVGVYRSTDSGDSWSLVGLDDKPVLRLRCNNLGQILAATRHYGVYLSRK